jgi:uncharacterized spore protein YtfJ
MNPEKLLKGARDAIAVRRVFGEPVERDGITLTPVAAVRGGGGGGGDAEGNGGGGFGLEGRPVGAFVVRDGSVSFEPTVDVTRLALAGLAALALIAFFFRPAR